MTKHQEEVYMQMIYLLAQLSRAKYEPGAKKYKTKMLDWTYEELEQHELEEMLDLIHYRLAKMLKRRLELKTVKGL